MSTLAFVVHGTPQAQGSMRHVRRPPRTRRQTRQLRVGQQRRPTHRDPTGGIMITDNELDAIQARADAATPGPWVMLGNSVAQQVDHCTCAGHIPCYGHEQYCGLEGPVILEAHQTDATFAAHARSDVPRLVAEIRRLRAGGIDQETDDE